MILGPEGRSCRRRQRRPYRLWTACRVTPSTVAMKAQEVPRDAGAAHRDGLRPVELLALVGDPAQHVQRVAGLGGGDGHGVLLGHGVNHS